MTDTPHLAREIVVNHTDHTIHIDGELFPYFVAESPRAVVPLYGIHSLTVDILADALTVIGTPDSPPLANQGESR